MNSSPHRRQFLTRAVALSLLGACGEKTISHSKDWKIAPTEITPDEFEALGQATTARGQPLLIKGKLLGPPHRLDNTSLHDIEFVDCDFMGQFMFNVSLTNVKFTRCAIVGVRWEDGKWTNVSFVDCAGEDRANNIVPGAGDGTNLFQRCRFIGDTPPPDGDFDSLEFQGGIGAAGKTTFDKCTFERMKIRVVGTAIFNECHFASAGMESPRSRVPIDELRIAHCDGSYGLDLSTPGITTLSISDSSFGELLVNHCKSKSVRLDKVRGNVDLTGLDAELFAAVDCEFKSSLSNFDKTFGGGLRTVLSRFARLSLVNCQFTGENVRWNSAGKAPRAEDRDAVATHLTGQSHPETRFTEWKSATIEKTLVANADWSYSLIGTLALTDTSFTGSKIAHCEIDELVLNTVTLGGALDFSDTRVSRVRSKGVEKKNLNLIKDKLTKLDLAAFSAEGHDLARGARAAV